MPASAASTRACSSGANTTAAGAGSIRREQVICAICLRGSHHASSCPHRNRGDLMPRTHACDNLITEEPGHLKAIRLANEALARELNAKANGGVMFEKQSKEIKPCAAVG